MVEDDNLYNRSQQYIIISSLYVCMAIKHIIVYMFLYFFSFFFFAVINLRGVSTNKTIINI